MITSRRNCETNKLTDTQIIALPESFRFLNLDGIRAKARIEARNAKGIQKEVANLPPLKTHQEIWYLKRLIIFPLKRTANFAKANNFYKKSFEYH